MNNVMTSKFRWKSLIVPRAVLLLLPLAIAAGSLGRAEAKGGHVQIFVDDVWTQAGDVATFGVRLRRASTSPVTVYFETSDGTATVADGDYLLASGTLTFAPGQTYKTVAVQTLPDELPEPGEEFSLRAATITPDGSFGPSDLGTCNIRTQYQVSIHIAGYESVNPGDVATFIVALNVIPTSPITVDCTTIDRSATVADGDYFAAWGTLTFEPGEQYKEVFVQTLPNLYPEYIEEFYLWAGIVATDGSIVDASICTRFIAGELDDGSGGGGPDEPTISP